MLTLNSEMKSKLQDINVQNLKKKGQNCELLTPNFVKKKSELRDTDLEISKLRDINFQNLKEKGHLKDVNSEFWGKKSELRDIDSEFQVKILTFFFPGILR